MTRVHDFDWPDRLVVGTVGAPGQRTFFLQARAGQHLVSAALEKEQSAALAEKIDEVLDDLMAEAGNPYHIPAEAPAALDDDAPLDEPVVEQFRIGLMSLGWDPRTAQVVIEAYPRETEEDATGDEPEEVLQVRIPVGAARSFSKRTRQVVESGRPICPTCLEPIDPEGHSCPGLDGWV